MMCSLPQKRYLVTLFYSIFSLFIIFFFSVQSNFAQFCTGSIFYQLRDESGEKMSREQLAKVTVKVIDGIESVIEKNLDQQIFYKITYPTGDIKIKIENPLRVSGSCGQLKDLTLQYEGKSMKLIFENNDNWTRFMIDSLPFQAGTFKLEKVTQTEKGLRNFNKQVIPCQKDPNNQSNLCLVSARTWKRLDEK
jgi:hypothetical protein